MAHADCQLIVTDKVVFGATFSTCVVYIKTIIIFIIIHLGVIESGGYFPWPLAAR